MDGSLLTVLAMGATMLAPGVSVRGAVAATGVQPYTLRVPPGSFVTGSVDQGDADLSVKVLTPDGTAVATYDGRSGGAELVSFKSDVGGIYRIEVRAAARLTRPARFTIRFEVPRHQAEDDDRRLEAERLATDAKRLAAKKDRELLQQAVVAREGAQSIWRELGDRSAEAGMVFEKGRALYALNAFQGAAAAFDEALALYRLVDDQRGVAECLNNLAATEWQDARIPEAIGTFRQAVEISHRIGHVYAEAGARTNLGILLWQAGELEDSRRQSEQAFTIVRRLGDRRAEAYVRNSLGNALESLGELRAALQQTTQSAQLFQQVGEQQLEGAERIRQARLQLALGQQAVALATAQRGLALIRQTPDRLAYADALEQIGRIQAARKDVNGADESFRLALDVYRQIDSRKGESESHHDLGVLHLRTNQLEMARAELQTARELSHDAGLQAEEAQTLLRIAESYGLAGDLDRERTEAEAALGIAQHIRDRVFERELRISVSNAMRQYSAEVVDVLMRLHDKFPDRGFAIHALETAERARALELTSVLRKPPLARRDAGNAVAVDRLNALDQQIDYWSWQQWQQADRPAAVSTGAGGESSQLDRLLREREKLEADLLRADPVGSALIQPEPMSLATIQRELLDQRTALIEFSLGEPHSFVWAVTSEHVIAARLPGRAEIEEKAQHLFKLMSSGTPVTLGPDASAQRRRELSNVAQMLFAPLGDVLGYRRLLIVADGALHYVPFAALPVSTRSTPLSGEHDIVMLPSATTLVLLRRQAVGRHSGSALVVVLADPVFDPADSRVRRPSSLNHSPAGDLSRPFGRLPYSFEEGQAVTESAPSGQARIFIDFEADRLTATGPVVSAARYVHFATHAVEDDTRPDLSAIVLSLVDRDGRARDGFLRLHDVYDLHLTADLVTLSACRTAAGKAAGGEGLRSLAAGFFHAGARRVLASLWATEDENSAVFMRIFYRALLGPAKESPAAALATAQRAMLADPRWQDPYYWSGFVLQGEW